MGEDDFGLDALSPCIDAANGPEATYFDIAGVPRDDYDGTSNNTGVGPPWADIGAYEYRPQ